MTAPRRPGDFPTLTSFDDLLATHHRHALALVNDRCQIGDPLTAEQVAEHTLADLAVTHALAERLLWHRWLTASEALAAGATLTEVADAMGLTVVEVRAGLRSWADGQARLRAHYGTGGLGPDEVAEVHALAERPAEARTTD